MRKASTVIWQTCKIARTTQFAFCKKKQSKGFTGTLKSIWQQTFPEQQDQIKAKYSKVKQSKHYSKQEIAKMQQEISEYTRTAMVETEDKGTKEKKKSTLANLIPESLKQKIKGSKSYQQYSQFKQNLKQYASTRDGAIANAGTYVYSQVSTGSPLARATEMMRRFIPDFNIFELEKQSTVIFKQMYDRLMQSDIQTLEKMAGEQALQYFKAYIKINKAKNQEPKYKQFIHNYPSTIKGAKVGDKSLPTFNFQIKAMELYCMVDKNNKIVDGDDERIIESVFDFSLVYDGNYISELGHPWQITQFRKVQQRKMLV